MHNFFKGFMREAFRSTVLLLGVVAIAAVALAYAEPGSAPTGGTVYPPVNTSVNAQTKSGQLSIGSVSPSLVTISSSGMLNAFTQLWGQSIVSNTTVTSQQFCLPGSNPTGGCISLWPAGGGTGQYDNINMLYVFRLDNAGTPIGMGFVLPVPNGWTSSAITNWVRSLADAFGWRITYQHMRMLPNQDPIANSTNGRPCVTFSAPCYYFAETYGVDKGLNNGANVGVGGVQNPAFPLDVFGQIRSGFGGFVFPDGSVQTTAATGGSSQWVTSGSNIYNANIGNVGIGTKNPRQGMAVGALDVAGVISIENGANIGTTDFTAAPWTSNGGGVIGWNKSSGSGEMSFVSISGGGSDGGFSFYDKNTPLMRIMKNGNVGIGTMSPSQKLDVVGNLNVSGQIFAGVKDFKIDDPLDPAHTYLFHSTLEGPEHGVYYRGEAQLQNGRAEITLPAYFEALTRKEDRTVLLTNIDGGDMLWVETRDGSQVKDGTFVVRSSVANSSQRFNWEVKAVRADVAPLEVEVPKESK